MFTVSGKAGVSCSFCNKKVIRADRIDVMGFRFHSLCADNVATVLGKVKAFNAWKRTHPQAQNVELTA
jgi:hypothetical protein